MIEQINGAGLSGKTGKSTKQGAGGLFSKLLAMLEKNAETSGKGKGLQLQEGKSIKGTGMIDSTEKTDLLKGTKGKDGLALITKEKSDAKETDESATAGLAGHVIINQPTALNKGDKSSKVSVLIDGELKEKTSAKVSVGLNEEIGNKNLLNKGIEKGVEKGAQIDPGLNQKAQVLIGKGDDVSAIQQQGVVGKQAQAGAVIKSSLTADNKSAAELTAPVPTAEKGSVSEQAVKTGPSATFAKVAVTSANPQGMASEPELDVAAKALIEGEKQGSSAHPTGEKVALKASAKVSAEAMNIAVGAHLQQGKSVQAQQPQPVQSGTTATAIASGAQITMSESSMGDSGSQSSDQRGGQGSQSLTSSLGDVKSTGYSSSTQSNFQSYLTTKTPPSMSLFDSMNHIAQSAKNGQTRLEIQLEPHNLGKIQISLQSDAGKQLQVHMVVDQGMTRAALEQQLPQLRSALAQQGFDLSGFSMGSQDQQASSGGDGKGQRAGGFSQDAELPMVDASVAQPQQKNTGSGLSIRV